jgi:hypothetical protein
MFARAKSFNQSLTQWNVNKVYNHSGFADDSALEAKNIPPSFV